MATYKSCKEDRLHSLSLATDRDTFITADEGWIDLWNIERTNNVVYNLVDYDRKKSTPEDMRINSAVFSQNSDNLFLYTTSSGQINLCDLRERSDFHEYSSLTFVNPKSNHTSHMQSVSEAKFVPGSQNIVSRDLMTVKLWDLRSASSAHDTKHKPLYTA